MGDSLCLELVGNRGRHLPYRKARLEKHATGNSPSGKRSPRAGLIDAHPNPRRPQRGFGNKCLSTVDPKHPTGVSPFLSAESLFFIDYLNICMYLKATTRHYFLKLWQTRLT